MTDRPDEWSNSGWAIAMKDLPRLFILGAGFSVPAGLPTARELLGLVLEELHLHVRYAPSWRNHWMTFASTRGQ